MPPFHLAFPVMNIEDTRRFYVDILGCKVGREAEKWIDFDFFGHQISAHVKPEQCEAVETNAVDGDNVPVRHFGAVLEWSDWEALRDKVAASGTAFLIEPRIRFEGQAGEQGIFFLHDPSGNAMEFKTFKNMDSLFDRG
ncbi:VOC family protein [Sneathiella chinensis]|uniref:Glyoxalase n=1 Tax=Sneathiella chinensis TaxID=349750 RepID=A0ABQ5U368_9PROT|nr:VOC family protein [Sneathiella chinensis]GLQ06178.1 glyoxalase [Sneathiella chinensis]